MKIETQTGTKTEKKNRTRTDGRACRASSFPGWDEPEPPSTTDRLCDPSAFQEGAGRFARRRLREPLLILSRAVRLFWSPA